MNTLIVLNFLFTCGVLALLAKPYVVKRKKASREEFENTLAGAASLMNEAIAFLETEKQLRLPRPIHHPKAEGPLQANVTRSVGYWVAKGQPGAEPFLAAWYDRPVTPGSTMLDENGMIVPVDTYVDPLGRRISGARFREEYEPAPEVMQVAKIKAAPLHMRPFVTPRGKATPKLSAEEEAALAEEYDLVDKSPAA
jgi:hypothetical protein